MPTENHNFSLNNYVNLSWKWCYLPANKYLTTWKEGENITALTFMSDSVLDIVEKFDFTWIRSRSRIRKDHKSRIRILKKSFRIRHIAGKQMQWDPKVTLMRSVACLEEGCPPGSGREGRGRPWWLEGGDALKAGSGEAGILLLQHAHNTRSRATVFRAQIGISLAPGSEFKFLGDVHLDLQSYF